MVQVIKGEPGFGAQLGRGLGHALVSGGEALYSHKKEKNERQRFKKQFGIDAAPEERKEIAKQFAKYQAQEEMYKRLFPSKQSGSTTADQLRAGETQPQKKDEGLGLDLSNTTPEERTKLAFINPALGKQATEEEKIKIKRSEAQERAYDKSYDAQKDFIDSTTQQHKSFETETKPRLLQMRNLPDEALVGPTAAKFLETMGIPLGALEDPSSEVYHKLSQDLLKGLPDTYGSRILKVEVDNFLKTIPTLQNSPDGRRMIASNMLKLGEVYYNAMRRQQKGYQESGKKFPKDFEQDVFDQVKPQIDKLNDEFVKMAEIKAVPKNTVPFFSPQGEVVFVPKNPEAIKWALENQGKRIW